MLSLFSLKSPFTPKKQSLLLQFLIDCLENKDAKAAADWISLLALAFPDLPTASLKKSLKRKNVFEHLIPFLEVCKNDEGLILFLLRRGKTHLLQDIPFQQIKKRFQARGFSSLASEVEELTKKL